MFRQLTRPAMGLVSSTSITSQHSITTTTPSTTLARQIMTFSKSHFSTKPQQKLTLASSPSHLHTKTSLAKSSFITTPLHHQQQRTFFMGWWKHRQLRANSEIVPDPYYGKYTPRTDPIPDGYWTQNPYGKPYFVGHTPQIENLMKQAENMKLYKGLEHPANPSRERDLWDHATLGIPGKYFGYALFGFWFYLFWDIRGRSMKDNALNAFWRIMYLSQLDPYYPTNYFTEVEWPALLHPPQPSTLLPAVTPADIEEFLHPKPKEEEKKDGEEKEEEEEEKKH